MLENESIRTLPRSKDLGAMRVLFEDGNRCADQPAIFLDRDGVINRRKPGGYVFEWSQFAFVPGIRQALRDLSKLQLPLIIISNQAGVGKGIFTCSALEEMTRRLHESLSNDGTKINAFYYCIHTTTDDCGCRKPRAGLLVQAATDFGVDLTRSIFIGDSETDVQAARLARCEPILFGATVSPLTASADSLANVSIASTAEVLYSVAVERLAFLSAKRNQTSATAEP